LEAYTPFEAVESLLLETLTYVLYWVIGFSIFAFISTLIREIIKDMEDYEGDKKYACNTLSVVYGKDKAKFFSQILIGIMFLMLAYFQYLQISQNQGGEEMELAKAQTRSLITVMYLFFAVQIPLIYVAYKLKLATSKVDYHHLSSTIKFIMLTGIGYILLFYFLIIKL
jgi:4-hydroxybenzoate polyprenyltransferase